jgi:hypothetical protein
MKFYISLCYVYPIRRFPFSSELRRMTVLVHHTGIPFKTHVCVTKSSSSSTVSTAATTDVTHQTKDCMPLQSCTSFSLAPSCYGTHFFREFLQYEYDNQY